MPVRLGLLAEKNENSGRERQNSHDYCRNGDAWNERHEADDDQINRQEQHTEIFGDVYHVCLSLVTLVDLSRRSLFVTIKVIPRRLPLTKHETTETILIIRDIRVIRG